MTGTDVSGLRCIRPCDQDLGAVPAGGSADQIEDYALARTRGAGPVPESAVLTTDCRINRETCGLSQVRLTIRRNLAAPAADGTPAEGDDA